MLRADGAQQISTKSSPAAVWIGVADAVTLILLALAVWAMVGEGLNVFLLGYRITAANATRLLIEAGVVFAVRHAIAYAPPLHARIWSVLALTPPSMVAFGVPAIVYLAVILHGYDGDSYMRGDCDDYFRTARSIIEDADLDIRNQFPQPWETSWSGVSVAIDGRLVPKHPIPMPLASTPFVAAFGRPGALVFNIFQIGCLLAVLYRLAQRWTSRWPAAVAVALTGTLTFLPHYVWNYSPDVFAALVVVAALLPLTLANSSSNAKLWGFFLGGLLAGVAVIAKQPLVVFLPTTFAFVTRPIARSGAALALGMAVSLGAFALHNTRLFGSPFVTAYDRIAIHSGTEIATTSQRTSFTLPFSEGARGQIFDPKHGLLTTSAITLISLAALPLLAARSGAMALHIGASSLLLFVMFSMYDQWNTSHYGNRFLLPVVALGAIPLASLFEWTRRRFRGPALSNVEGSKG